MRRHKLSHGMCIISDDVELPVCNDNYYIIAFSNIIGIQTLRWWFNQQNYPSCMGRVIVLIVCVCVCLSVTILAGATGTRRVEVRYMHLHTVLDVEGKKDVRNLLKMFSS